MNETTTQSTRPSASTFELALAVAELKGTDPLVEAERGRAALEQELDSGL